MIGLNLRDTALVMTAVLTTLVGTGAAAFEATVTPETVDDDQVYSPFVNRDYPDQVLFGDLHFHTEISFDAGLIGTSLTMHDAFRIARGERILSNTGQPVQLIRPLDFLAITEHAEMLGLATAMRSSDPRLLADEWGARTHQLFNSGQQGRMAAFRDIIDLGTVQGMIMAFATLGQGAPDVGELAMNISQALFTTAGGLTIAVPCVAFYYIFRNSANRIVLRMEAITMELIKDLRNVEVVAE